MNKIIKAISLFSGCGGADLGLEGGFTYLGKRYQKTGIKIIWANDIDKAACVTFHYYFKDAEIVKGDIEKIDFNKLPKKCDILIGGFPCQDFSLVRGAKRQGIEVKRGSLYKSFIKVVELKKPKIFIAENVKGILSANDEHAIELITEELANINGGYNIYCDLYKFADYGLPQFRERVLIIGVRSDVKYKYTKPKSLVKKHVDSEEALKNIDPNSFNHEIMKVKEKTAKLLKTIPEGRNVEYLGKDHPLYVKGLMSNIYRKLDRTKPSSTIIASGGGGTWGYHYSEPRPLTNRERARLQGFPDDFVFSGTVSEVRRQIGNAVPPIGIYPVAKELTKAFKADKITPAEVLIINICGEEKFLNRKPISVK